MLQTGMSEAYAVTPRPGESCGSRVIEQMADVVAQELA
jgi:hypothetical protein